MTRHKHPGTCTRCRKRPAKYPDDLCERCWRYTRYHDPNDNYRAQLLARQSRYWQRKHGGGRSTTVTHEEDD